MGNQASDAQGQEYQRMGSQRANPGLNRIRSVAKPNAQSSKQQQLQLENALNTLQSMFLSVDREVLRLVLIEQCGGNMDHAVNTLLSMQTGSSVSAQSSTPKGASKVPATKSSTVLYDDNMRPITVTADFLQPPSYYLSTYFGLTARQIEDIQRQQAHEEEQRRDLEAVARHLQSPRPVYIDATIVGQWTNLLKRYKFKSEQRMAELCQMDCPGLNRCGSLVRVIFMMKLYQRLCNESGAEMNAQCGQLMHEYLARGFKEYSLIQLINDCNHLIQYHKFGGDNLKNMRDEGARSLMRNQMREYFGHQDVFTCRVIKRIWARQDMDEAAKAKMTAIEVETDIVDKYHRMFYHPLN